MSHAERKSLLTGVKIEQIRRKRQFRKLPGYVISVVKFFKGQEKNGKSYPSHEGMIRVHIISRIRYDVIMLYK